MSKDIYAKALRSKRKYRPSTSFKFAQKKLEILSPNISFSEDSSAAEYSESEEISPQPQVQDEQGVLHTSLDEFETPKQIPVRIGEIGIDYHYVPVCGEATHQNAFGVEKVTLEIPGFTFADCQKANFNDFVMR